MDHIDRGYDRHRHNRKGVVPWPEMCSDASGSLGFGASFDPDLPCGLWSVAFCSEYTELFVIVLAAHVWDSSWFRQVVLFHSDSKSLLHILKVMLRCLRASATKHKFQFFSRHLAGTDNKVADIWSCFQWQTSYCLAPKPETHSLAIPSEVRHLLTYQP